MWIWGGIAGFCFSFCFWVCLFVVFWGLVWVFVLGLIVCCFLGLGGGLFLEYC